MTDSLVTGDKNSTNKQSVKHMDCDSVTIIKQHHHHQQQHPGTDNNKAQLFFQQFFKTLNH